MHDGYGGYLSLTRTITGYRKIGRSVAENSPAGTQVGSPVTGTPYNGETLTYTLKGKAADSGNFAIDSASGQISVKQGATLDYETDNPHRETEYWQGKVFAKFYRAEVHYTVDGHAAVIHVLIRVDDVEAGKPDAPTVTRTQFSEPTDPALDVTWTDGAANGLTITGYEIRWRKQGDDTWPHITGKLANIAYVTFPGLEPGATYEFQVRAATSEEGDGPWSDTGSGQANTPPNLTNVFLLPLTIPWGAVGTYPHWPLSGLFGDADGDTLVYSTSSEYPGIISSWLHSDLGTLWVKAVNPSSAEITYAASDAYGGYAYRTVTVTGVANETRSVAENSAAGTNVGRHLGGTPYNNEALTHTMTGEVATSGLFVLDSATGQLSVAQGATLDYETKSSYTGKVHFTVQGQAVVINLTVNVTDIETGTPGTPTLTRTRFSVPTNPALDVAWTAPTSGGDPVASYEAQYRKQGATEWTDYTGTLSAETTSLNLPDLEAGAIYEVRVRAVGENEGAGSWSDTGSGQANRPPNATSQVLPSLQVAQAASIVQTIGTGYFLDPDGDALRFSASTAHPKVITPSITGPDESTLTVVGVNPSSSTVTYGAHDGYGGFASRPITVTVTANETRNVGENSPAGSNVGDPVAARGPNATAVNDYTLTGEAADSGAFQIDSATGQISVAQGATLVYDTKSSYTGQVGYTVQGLSGDRRSDDSVDARSHRHDCPARDVQESATAETSPSPFRRP